MKRNVFVCLTLMFVILFCGCVTDDTDYTLYVVQYVIPQTIGEVNSDHTEYTTFNEHVISGYYSQWKGEFNNTAAIEEDYSMYKTWTCNVDTDETCKEIKPGDILVVKYDIFNEYEMEIVGSIK